ncbi:hypothetical protein [Schaalia sp. Marseille-Q2122]|uniref:hypothetical protein n=1 Tax=Schaalia sp. Marseille-Q2122 TaxID=2736604 RepID=UPI00158C119B|nr:hypothetical protein [Schaalia sp. Marseille-Q2122]
MASVYFLGLFAIIGLVVWWFGMFSDSGFGQMIRAMNKSSSRGKNEFSLSYPAVWCMFLFLLLLLVTRDLDLPKSVAVIGVTGLLGCVVFFILGFFPFSLPRWMYPEYHLVRRERVRAEKLARGEVVKMPSSGRVAVEAQRLEQIVREQEAAQRADKDESSR